LFGLHLIGLLGRIPVRAGLIVGGLLAFAGVAIWIRLVRTHRDRSDRRN